MKTFKTLTALALITTSMGIASQAYAITAAQQFQENQIVVPGAGITSNSTNNVISLPVNGCDQATNGGVINPKCTQSVTTTSASGVMAKAPAVSTYTAQCFVTFTGAPVANKYAASYYVEVAEGKANYMDGPYTSHSTKDTAEANCAAKLAADVQTPPKGFSGKGIALNAVIKFSN